MLVSQAESISAEAKDIAFRLRIHKRLWDTHHRTGPLTEHCFHHSQGTTESKSCPWLPAPEPRSQTHIWKNTDMWLQCQSENRGFPGSSVGNESACNAGDPGSIPGLGRSPGGGHGNTLQYSWASLVAQLVKNPPPIRETLVWFLSWEDLLEEGMVTHSSILAWRIPMTRAACWATDHGVAKSRTWLSN